MGIVAGSIPMPGPVVTHFEDKGPSRETSIVRQAVIKSVLESPAFADMARTIKSEEIVPTAKAWAEELERWVNR